MSKQDRTWRDGVQTPRELVIHLTYQCPLKCAHCCFSSDMTQAGHLPEAQVQQAIDQAAQIHSMERVNFVGGEPFLHQGILESACRHAREHGLRASATTSAYWATTEVRAIEVLAPLAEAGLDRIIISYDDPHAAFLREKNIVNAYRAARTLGVFAKIAVVVEPGCRIDKNYMASLLGLPLEGDETGEIYETTINSTGRAREDASEEQFEEAGWQETSIVAPASQSCAKSLSFRQDRSQRAAG